MTSYQEKNNPDQNSKTPLHFNVIYLTSHRCATGSAAQSKMKPYFDWNGIMKWISLLMHMTGFRIRTANIIFWFIEKPYGPFY